MPGGFLVTCMGMWVCGLCQVSVDSLFTYWTTGVVCNVSLYVGELSG